MRDDDERDDDERDDDDDASSSSCASEGAWVRAVVALERVETTMERVEADVAMAFGGDVALDGAAASRARSARRRLVVACEDLARDALDDRVVGEAVVSARVDERVRAATAGKRVDAATAAATEALTRACETAKMHAMRERIVREGGVEVVVVETVLGNGVGARLWGAAKTACAGLARARDVVAGKRVLELGAGVGACGFFCAKLGAASVALTDFEPPLLDALERATERNGVGSTCVVAALDWTRELRNERTPGDRALADDAVFDFIIGTDVLYERQHADALSACIARRLAPDGECLLVNAVRYEGMFEQLLNGLRARGLDVEDITDEFIEPSRRGGGAKKKDWHDDRERALRARRRPDPIER